MRKVGRVEKYPVHCKCIDKDIEINVGYFKEQGIEVMSSTTCNSVDFKEPIHNCEFENSEECSLKDYK
jgi:hypothetical protein